MTEVLLFDADSGLRDVYPADDRIGILEVPDRSVVRYFGRTGIRDPQDRMTYIYVAQRPR